MSWTYSLSQLRDDILSHVMRLPLLAIWKKILRIPEYIYIYIYNDDIWKKTWIYNHKTQYFYPRCIVRNRQPKKNASHQGKVFIDTSNEIHPFVLLSIWHLDAHPWNLESPRYVGSQSGWWLTYPSEKWWSESQLGWWNSQYDGKNKMHVPNHQTATISIPVLHAYIYIYMTRVNIHIYNWLTPWLWNGMNHFNHVENKTHLDVSSWNLS